mgnify:CR=1 FL=1
MIQSNELRIGNWINLYDNFNSQVTGLTNTKKVWCVKNPIDEKCAWFTNNLNAIPLTEEWLIDFGFKKDKIDSTYYKDDFEICLPNFVRWKESHLSGIRNVHQLQNLYFALTRKELTL